MPYYLPRNKKTALMKKLGDYCAEVLRDHIQSSDLQKNELESYCGLKPNRVSEILSGVIRENTLIQLLEGGIISIMDITSNIDLDDKDRKYLVSLMGHENGLKLMQIAAKLMELGIFEKGEKLLMDLIDKEEKE